MLDDQIANGNKGFDASKYDWAPAGDIEAPGQAEYAKAKEKAQASPISQVQTLITALRVAATVINQRKAPICMAMPHLTKLRKNTLVIY